MPRFRWPSIALIALLVVTWWVYFPGLTGGFLFDDFVNLNALGATGRVDDWATFCRYITSGTADPTGRPLALLSFLLDARDWPADPRPFLRTNVLLHLANAALLFSLLRQLGRTLEGDYGRSVATRADNAGTDRSSAPSGAKGRATPGSKATRIDAAALIGAALWALHPLLVSTTLYVVQREAMLAATFTLLGLLAWGRGRGMIGRSPRAGAAWMIGGIGLGTLLAVLCKANGALLPLLAWVLEATAYRDAARTPLATRLRWLLLVIPSLTMAWFILSNVGHWSEPVASRPWSIGQRVLTEPRVLLDYLRLLVVPRVLSTGLYNDGYVWSTSLLRPWSTIPALAVVVGLLAGGFALRRRAPAVAAALLFFFAGHLLESTTIPLELYFEHRNYLPAMLLGWPLARGIVRWQAPMAMRSAVAAALLCVLAAITWQRASLWADQPRMAGLWAATNPGSSRAIATQAIFDIRGNRPDLAMSLLSAPWQRRPYDLQLALNYINASCLAAGPTGPDTRAVERALRNNDGGAQLLYRWLNNMLDAAIAHRCPRVSIDQVERWTSAALANPRLATMPGDRQDLHAVLGRVALARGDASGALREFRQSLDALPGPDAAAQQSSLLASAGHPAEGLALLDHYDSIASRRKVDTGWNIRRLHAWVLERQGYWPHEFAVLRGKMREALSSRSTGR